MLNSIYSPNSESNYEYIAGVNDSCIMFSMEPDCPDNTANISGDSIQDFDGLVAQSITCSCARQPAIIYEIGTKNYYAVDAKPQGQGRLQNVLGPTRQSVQTLQTLGDICNPTRISITIKKCSCFCDKDKGTGYGFFGSDTSNSLLFRGGFLSNVTLSATAKDLVVQGSWDFIFQDLQLWDGTTSLD